MPVIHLDINDAEEFTLCNFCESPLQGYNNTSLSSAPVHTLRTKTLLSYHHLNCAKCGIYVEFHSEDPNEENLIFICSKSTPCRHCLCYECGLLYGLNPDDDKKCDIINQLQYSSTAHSNSAEIDSKPQNSSVLATSDRFDDVGIVSNSTLITEIMNAISSTNGEESHTDSSSVQSTDASALALLMGTVMALFVWFGLYLSSPDLFRLTACVVWFTIFYVLISLFFNENENIQRAVYSLFGLSPILASLYLLVSTRRYPQRFEEDVMKCIQFFCVFGCVAYVAVYWSPLEMYLFLRDDFTQLPWTEQAVSVFIAMSVVSFVCILTRNYGQCQRKSMDIEHIKACAAAPADNVCMSFNEELAETQVEGAPTEPKKKRKRRRRRKHKQTAN